MPIILAQISRSYQAKVAHELCDRGNCASKDLAYYGMKLHALGFRGSGPLSLPEFLKLTTASEHDLSAIRKNFQQLLVNQKLFLDRAYYDEALAKELQEPSQVKYLPRSKEKEARRMLEQMGT